jgi:hypothetical protein
MISVFGPGNGKSNRQCKTKDQNFKIRHYKRADEPIDLMDVALEKLIAYINKMKKTHKEGKALESKDVSRVNRFE